MRQFIDLVEGPSDAVSSEIRNAETRAARTGKAIELVTQARDYLGTNTGDEIRPMFDHLLRMLKQANLSAKHAALNLQHHSM